MRFATFLVLGSTLLAQPALNTPGAVKTNPKDGLPYVWVPPGSFLMGCGDNHRDCEADEKPAHRVRISKGFWIGQTEATVAAYGRFAQASKAEMPPEPKFGGRPLNPGWRSADLPMNQVTWFQARDYCQWAGLRLPTEAEWEYAARAGAGGQSYAPLDAAAWYGDNSGEQRLDSRTLLDKEGDKYDQRMTANLNRPRAVGQKKANAWGLHDVLGNVWEWVADWHSPAEYQGRGGGAADPSGPPSGDQKILRGGSWVVDDGVVRLPIRSSAGPSARGGIIGFRCAGPSLGP